MRTRSVLQGRTPADRLHLNSMPRVNTDYDFSAARTRRRVRPNRVIVVNAPI
jgi:hypothetical protein